MRNMREQETERQQEISDFNMYVKNNNYKLKGGDHDTLFLCDEKGNKW